MNDRLNGADTGAHDELPVELEEQETEVGEPDAPEGSSTSGSAGASSGGGGRFGIRRSRTRAEERIAELDLYFRTVLSRIGAGRVAKRRVLAFLEKEALADERVAGFTATL